MHPLCLAHLTVLELAPPQAVQVAAAAGYPLVSLRLVSDTDAARPMLGGGTALMRETLAVLRDTGVRVHDVELLRLQEDTDPAAMEPVLAAAQELGASRVLVTGEQPPGPALADRFARLCEAGARRGLAMGLEFIPWRGIGTLEAARQLVAMAGAGEVVVDALHLQRSGGRAQDLAQLPAAAWGWCQLCDAPQQRPATTEALVHEARNTRLPPGEGALDLAGLVRALPEGCVVSLEVAMRGLPDCPPPLERARRLRAAAQAVLEAAGG